MAALWRRPVGEGFTDIQSDDILYFLFLPLYTYSW